ncbi:MAG: phosphatidylglycerophosphatase A [Gammaproteobacteria bacterium]|jgi:phosphatidylglycerophosphatase A
MSGIAKGRRLSVGLLRDPVHLFALGFGSGLSPWGPGTCGTLLAVPIAVALLQVPAPIAWSVVVLAIAVGVWITGESARRLGVHDHSGIVWDEIAAFLGLALLLPEGWPWLVAGFILFRIFDIAKPWPIREMDHSLRGGLGIMLDDLMAAVYSVVLIKLINYLATLN